jgi:hypothetical protein
VIWLVAYVVLIVLAVVAGSRHWRRKAISYPTPLEGRLNPD